VVRTLVPYLLARLPSSMILLALLLFVRHSSGSFVTAGAVSAAFAVAVAVCAPFLGRLVDVRGQTAVLVPTSLLHPLALASLLLAAEHSLPSWVGLVSAGVAGATLPPTSACMRALWPSLLEDDAQRDTAFSIEAVVIEICELGGPLLVGGLTAVVSPAAAVLASGILTGLGALLFALSHASRHSARGTWRTRRWRGPLSVSGVRRLLGVILLSTAGFAAFEVSIAGFATGHGSPASTGTLLAMWFGGSLIGGWAYGARRWNATPVTQLLALLVLVAAGTLLPLLATSPWSLAPLLFVAGLAIAPAISVQFRLMSEVAPERSRTEAFTWASTANFLGIAAGSGVAGWALDGHGVRGGIVVSAALGGATALLAVLGRHGLGQPRAERRSTAEDAYDLAIFNELARERDEALAAVALMGARNDELAREVAALRQQLRHRGTAVIRDFQQHRPDDLPENVTVLPRQLGAR
jgi:MFS family permease